MEKKTQTPDKHPQKQKRDKKQDPPLKSFVHYSSMGFQMVFVILIFFWAGSKLDERSSNEKPVFTAILTVLGVFAGIYLMLKDFIGKKDD